MSSRYDRRTFLGLGVLVAVTAACTERDAATGGLADQLLVELPDGRELTVHVRAGSTVTASTPVLIVLHGVERNPVRYLQSWEPLIEGLDVVVLAPEFDSSAFPGVDEYNLGGMRDGDDDRDVEDRTFAAIDAVLESARERLGVQASTVDLFGHSAGAQFVHRYLTFTPSVAVRRAVAANAGWYTMPDPDVDYPYGLEDAPKPRAPMERLLGADLVILLGDLDTADENLRQDDGADEQGKTRVERGKSYYQAGKTRSAELGVAFGWTVEVVSGVAHDQGGMARAAAQYLLPAS